MHHAPAEIAARRCVSAATGKYCYYLIVDPSIECSSLSDNPTAPYAWLAIAAYPVGVLALTATLPSSPSALSAGRTAQSTALCARAAGWRLRAHGDAPLCGQGGDHRQEADAALDGARLPPPRPQAPLLLVTPSLGPNSNPNDVKSHLWDMEEITHPRPDPDPNPDPCPSPNTKLESGGSSSR